MTWLARILGLGGWQTYLVVGLAALVLAFASWGALERRTASKRLERAVAAEQRAATLQAALKASEAEAAKQREIADAADRSINHVMVEREVVRTQTRTVFREVAREPDANDPLPRSLGVVAGRVRDIDARSRGRDQDRTPGAAPGAAPRPGAARDAGGPGDQRAVRRVRPAAL